MHVTAICDESNNFQIMRADKSVARRDHVGRFVTVYLCTKQLDDNKPLCRA
jgi:hypothetical protein